MVIANILHELLEIAKLCKAEKSVSLGLKVHFLSMWNYLDMGNMVLQVVAMIVWMNYQAKRRAELFPKLRYDVYDNPASPDANYFLPRKKALKPPPPPPPPAFADNRTGIGAAGARYVDPFKPAYNRWELENDESGIEALGEMILTINELSDFLVLYFCVQGIALLLMVARLLKLFDFQKHLDITVKTLARSGIDILHFMLIFFYTLVCTSMVAHLMLGSMYESFATVEQAFNFHFEIIIGESVDVFADLLTDRSVVRTDIEYVTLVFYSFFSPVLIIFVMINMVLGIVADAFGEEKENLNEANEPTVFHELGQYFQQGRMMATARWPGYGKMVKMLRAVRKPTHANKKTTAGVLGKHMGGGGGDDSDDSDDDDGGGGGGFGPGALGKSTGLMSQLRGAGLVDDDSHDNTFRSISKTERVMNASSKFVPKIGVAGAILSDIKSPRSIQSLRTMHTPRSIQNPGHLAAKGGGDGLGPLGGGAVSRAIGRALHVVYSTDPPPPRLTG
jgi:hypothetical protein